MEAIGARSCVTMVTFGCDWGQRPTRPTGSTQANARADTSVPEERIIVMRRGQSDSSGADGNVQSGLVSGGALDGGPHVACRF